MKTRRCNHCKRELALCVENFYRSVPRNGGFSHWCKACMCEARRNNPRQRDSVNAYLKNYRTTRSHRERTRKQKTRWNERDGLRSSPKYATHWTSEEEMFLVENAANMTQREMAKKLGRTPRAVQNRVHKLRVRGWITDGTEVSP